MGTIWVHAEAAMTVAVASITLELLAKARELGDPVEPFYADADADAIAGDLGAHGAIQGAGPPAIIGNGALAGPALASAHGGCDRRR